MRLARNAISIRAIIRTKPPVSSAARPVSTESGPRSTKLCLYIFHDKLWLPVSTARNSETGSSVATSVKLKTSVQPGVSLHHRIRSGSRGQDPFRPLASRPSHPYEHELMAQYGCARMTVNRAIASLASAGLIERRRRAGSFVAQPRMQSAVLENPGHRGRGGDAAARITAMNC